MKKILFIIVLILQTSFIFAHERAGMVERQHKQEAVIVNAYQDGKLTENEYNKLMKEQKYIKDALETNDLDNHWTMLEHNMMITKLQRSEKRIKRYLGNKERF